VLFALVQGTPSDYIVGIYIGVWDDEKNTVDTHETHNTGFSVRMKNLAKDRFSIVYDIPTQCDVALKVYDSTGRIVETIVEGSAAAGEHTIQWDATNKRQHRLPNGVYFLQLEAGEYNTTEKIIVLR
jgi:flagellar hook assembly protein FlgD